MDWYCGRNIFITTWHFQLIRIGIPVSSRFISYMELGKSSTQRRLLSEIEAKLLFLSLCVVDFCLYF